MDTHDARCRPDQVAACRNAVRGDTLLTFDNGGTCEPRSYDIYDNLCTLNYYTSGVDYCCCAHERNSALCCRFYYDHNYFRCVSDKDSIYVPLSTTTILIISGIVFAIFLAIVITIAVKCSRGKRSRGSICNQDKPPSDPETSNPGSPMLPTGDQPNNNNRTDVTANDRAEPSAPLAEDVGIELPPYDRFLSEPAELRPNPHGLHGRNHGMFHSVSESDAHPSPANSTPEHLAYPPPPTYDEHHRDPVYQPHMNGQTSVENT